MGLTIGKRTNCNVCGKTFEMNEYSIRLARPRCMNCIQRKPKTKETSSVTSDLRSRLRKSADILSDNTNEATREDTPDDDEDLL